MVDEQAGRAVPWVPSTRPGESADDLELSEWVGQALGTASMCWVEVPRGEFDSVRCAGVHAALMGRINAVVDAVIAGTVKAMTVPDGEPGRQAAVEADASHRVVRTEEQVTDRAVLHTVDVEGPDGGRPDGEVGSPAGQSV